MSKPVLQIEKLSIDYRIQGAWLNVLHDIDLAVQPLQIHGLVGESGSGKSTLGLALMRYLAGNARIVRGHIWFGDHDLAQCSLAELRKIWGRSIALVPQNPLDSLNPSMTIGAQMREITQLHLGLSNQASHKRACEALEQVRIADPEQVLRRYPHQISGGMQQRVMIALALSTRPRLLVLDEPTTALDVTTQAVILDLIRDLVHEEQAAALYISHDLGTIAQVCDYVTVLYSGEVMETSTAEDLFQHPRHPYTIGLLNSLPGSAAGTESRLSVIPGVAPSLSERPSACVFAARCVAADDQCHAEKPPLESALSERSIRCWHWQGLDRKSLSQIQPSESSFSETTSIAPNPVLRVKQLRKSFGEQTWLDQILRRSSKPVIAVDNVSLQVSTRSTLGIVGESGSGKTTLARIIVALSSADQGDIKLLDQVISLKLAERDRETLRNLRMVFQNPNDALNPYISIGDAISRTIQRLNPEALGRTQIRERVLEVLDAVGLTALYYDRFPNQLSGGEKQRVAIARAFAAHPALIIADEPTSSLDVSVQAVILNLLKDLRAQKSMSYVLISHDLDVIRYMADWIIVMYLGEIVEQGSAEHLSGVPLHPYTEALLSAAPVPDPSQALRSIRLEGDVPSPRNKPAGCPFHTRCPRKIGDVCAQAAPPIQVDDDGHWIRCHIPLEDLRHAQTLSQEK